MQRETFVQGLMPMSTLQILLLIRPLLHVRLLMITSSYATNNAACHYIC